MVSRRILLASVLAIFIIGVSTIYLSNEFGVGPLAPTTKGLHDGGEVRFVVYEVSEPAENILGRLLSQRVKVNPTLNEARFPKVGEIYIFVNGTIGGGPFGYQESVVNSVPSDKEYSVIRSVKVVSWRRATNEGSEIEEKVKPHELKSFAEIGRAVGMGYIIVTNTRLIVNMSIVEWPGQN